MKKLSTFQKIMTRCTLWRSEAKVTPHSGRPEFRGHQETNQEAKFSSKAGQTKKLLVFCFMVNQKGILFWRREVPAFGAKKNEAFSHENATALCQHGGGNGSEPGVRRMPAENRVPTTILLIRPLPSRKRCVKTPCLTKSNLVQIIPGKNPKV